MDIRVGFGFDVHQLIGERDFWLGGILIPHTKGALGHSDADVMLHSICDALLGAAALGDIRKQFPDTSKEFKNIDSKILLKKVCQLIAENGYSISNVDTTLCLEKPKIAPHIPQMRKVISEVMNLEEGRISIKATTNEKMGFIGREEGIVSYAVALIKKE